MRLLLDTHVALWWSDDNVRLVQATRDAIATADVVFVSAASAWETSIKQALGRLRLGDLFAYSVERSGFSQLPITFDHAAAVGELPPHHSDPFDRMLIAQARVEGLTIVTHDRSFEPYGERMMWV